MIGAVSFSLASSTGSCRDDSPRNESSLPFPLELLLREVFIASAVAGAGELVPGYNIALISSFSKLSEYGAVCGEGLIAGAMGVAGLAAAVGSRSMAAMLSSMGVSPSAS